MTKRLTLGQARRIALAAQGFGVRRPEGRVTMRQVQVQAQLIKLAQFQIDSINVVQRAHYLPLFSRLGTYDIALLDRAAQRRPRRAFEYWGHAASLIDVTLQPALRFRMQRADREAWGRMRHIHQEQPELVARVREDVAARGPITAREVDYVEAENRSREHWGWNWSAVKTALEWLFWSGEITSAARNAQFERVFDLPERVLPATVLAAATPSVEQSHRILVRRAAAALGVATLPCLADYFRLDAGETRAAIDQLVVCGELEPVQIAGWNRPAWLWSAARRPRQTAARALVSPFDSLVFERRRLGELFGFDYRIEIYVPAEKRRHGYYVYPFLLGDRFAARVDLKADRSAGVLRVLSAWMEPGWDPAYVAAELSAELATLAGWLGLGEVSVRSVGDLAEPLRAVM